jgi:hypothetical protein
VISRKDKIIGISAVSIGLILFLWVHISMYWTETTCAKITSLKYSRGLKVYFVYDRNGKKISDNVNLSSFRYTKLKDLKSKKCCFVEYSIFWPYNIEIIDKDLRAD